MEDLYIGGVVTPSLVVVVRGLFVSVMVETPGHHQNLIGYYVYYEGSSNSRRFVVLMTNLGS